MAVDSVSLSMGYSVSSTSVSVKKQSSVSEDKGSAATEVAAKSDVFVKSETQTASVTYSKKLTSKQLEGIKNEQAESLKSLVQQMLGKQAGKSGAGGIESIIGTKQTEETATDDFYNDPEWGVDAVATRLMDMAVALSGGDTSKIAELRDAVERGFKAAGVEFGKELPGVCQSTYTETMKRFDYWEENGSMEGYKMEG